jgi:hypothetical protein
VAHRANELEGVNVAHFVPIIVRWQTSNVSAPQGVYEILCKPLISSQALSGLQSVSPTY